MLATDLSEYLAARGMPFREAHGAVARLMKHCAEMNASPVHMKISELRQYSEVFGEDVYALLTPKASVEGKKSPGGTAPALVEARAGELAKGAESK